MDKDAILIEKRDRLGVLTVNRPSVMNAVDLPVMRLLEDAFVSLERDEEVRVIIVTGAGDKAFIAGGDITDLNSRRGLAHYLEFAENVHRVFRRIEVCEKPTIAAVNGWALGGGMELMLAMDIRILAQTVRIGLPEITLGLFPGAGGTQRIIRQIPLCRAKELMFTGEVISADEAVALGIANRSVPKERLMDETMDIAGRIARMSAVALRLLKRTISHGADMTLWSSLAYEQAMIGLAMDSNDAHEGCAAFLEKRQPQFSGR